MRGLFVFRRGVFGSIDLYKHESTGIVFLLDDIESSDPVFLDALLCVEQRRFLEGIYEVGLHVYMNMNNKHGYLRQV